MAASFPVAELARHHYAVDQMVNRRFKFLLVLLNLLALNAYALASVAVHDTSAVPTHSSKHHAQGAIPNSMHGNHDGNHDGKQDCVMPCCQEEGAPASSPHAHNCACKAGLCSAMQLQSVAPQYINSKFNNSCKVDAMFTAMPAQNTAQRMLRPPIR